MGVVLQLLPAHANPTASRYFPHAGYLGLTPLKLAGVVRTRIDEQGKPLSAAAVVVSVKCYESRLGRLGGTQTNTLVNISQTLWSAPAQSSAPVAPSSPQYADLGDTDLPFRIVLPADTPGFSTSNFQSYRVFWRIEAAIEHIPIPAVGARQVKCFDLALTRYDAPVRPLKHPSPSSTQIARHIQYQLSIPAQPVAPQEPISIALNIRPLDPCIQLHKIVTSIERRIELSTDHPSSTTPPNTISRNTQNLPTIHDSGSATSSTTTLVGSSGPSPTKDALPLSSASSKLQVQPIVSVEVHDLTPEPDGSYVRFLTTQLPLPKSSHHWAVGETMQTSLASVRFFVCAKVHVQLPSGSTELIPLEEQELCVVAIEELERHRILQTYRASHSSRSSRPSASVSTSTSSSSNSNSVRRGSSLTAATVTPQSPSSSGNRHLPSPPPSPRTSSAKPSRRPKTTGQIDTKSRSVRDAAHHRPQLISPASSRARSQTPDFQPFPPTSTETFAAPPTSIPTPSSSGSSSFPTVLKVLPVRTSKPYSGAVAKAGAMLGKRPHTSSGPGSSREESGRKSQRPRSARGGTAEPMPTPAMFLPPPLPSSSAERPMSPRSNPTVAFAFEREQVKKWEKELDHIAFPGSGSANQKKVAMSSSGFSSFTPTPEVVAVTTYVHEPNLGLIREGNVSTSGRPPLSREEILAWEMEVERFSSASARQAL